MSLQDKKAEAEVRIQLFSNNISQRTAEVREFIEKTLAVIPVDWPYPGGWEKWISIRCTGIEEAKKNLLRAYSEKENIEKQIVIAEQKEKDRIEAEKDRIEAEKEATKLLKKQEKEAAKKAEEKLKADELAAKKIADELKAQHDAAMQIKADKEAVLAAEKAVKDAKIAELSAFIDANPDDFSRKTINEKINAVKALFRLKAMTHAEALLKINLLRSNV
jgi:membrane protein involved in colicin uptake